MNQRSINDPHKMRDRSTRGRIHVSAALLPSSPLEKFMAASRLLEGDDSSFPEKILPVTGNSRSSLLTSALVLPVLGKKLSSATVPSLVLR